MQRSIQFFLLGLLAVVATACAQAVPEEDNQVHGPWCGDRTCNGTENATTCPVDCGAAVSCGDGACNGSETVNSCASDCGGAGGGGGNAVCGDGNCNNGETATTCAADCAGGGGGGGGTCAHDVCTSGTALTSGCDACVTAVCSSDSYCCSGSWDSSCVAEVTDFCAADTCGGGGGGGTCDHDVCTSGTALTASCDTCAAAVCALDSFCCTTSWDSSCVGEVATECAAGTCAGGGACAHSECTSGTSLDASCSSCAATVCASDSFCCSVAWDSLCVDDAITSCGTTCP